MTTPTFPSPQYNARGPIERAYPEYSPDYGWGRLAGLLHRERRLLGMTLNASRAARFERVARIKAHIAASKAAA